MYFNNDSDNYSTATRVKDNFCWFSLKTVGDVRTVSAKVFCKVFQSLPAASRKSLGLKTVQTVYGEFDEFTGPKIEGTVVEVHNK